MIGKSVPPVVLCRPAPGDSKPAPEPGSRPCRPAGAERSRAEQGPLPAQCPRPHLGTPAGTLGCDTSGPQGGGEPWGAGNRAGEGPPDPRMAPGGVRAREGTVRCHPRSRSGRRPPGAVRQQRACDLAADQLPSRCHRRLRLCGWPGGHRVCFNLRSSVPGSRAAHLCWDTRQVTRQRHRPWCVIPHKRC